MGSVLLKKNAFDCSLLVYSLNESGAGRRSVVKANSVYLGGRRIKTKKRISGFGQWSATNVVRTFCLRPSSEKTFLNIIGAIM